jgi:S1-C subfamily serine protease
MAEQNQDELTRFSVAVAERAAAARLLVAEVHVRGHTLRSGILWRKDVVVVSEQALPRAHEAEVVVGEGSNSAARVIGRDPGTNVAVLRLDGSPQPAWSDVAAPPKPGALVIALGADGAGGSAVRLGAVHSVGPAWHSRAGGRIDRRIWLDIWLGRSEEGGPVIDSTGALLGMSTFGPQRRVLVIPTTTIERVLEPLLTNGRVPRGWLGAAVQPVLVPEALRDEAGHSQGLIVISVTGDGPAALAGVLMGDILVALDGTALGGTPGLAELLGPERVGKQVELRLIRAGVVQSLNVTVGERASR